MVCVWGLGSSLDDGLFQIGYVDRRQLSSLAYNNQAEPVWGIAL